MAITAAYALEQAILCEQTGKDVWAELWLEVASEAEKPEKSGGWLHDEDGGEDSYLPKN